ncbi:MBL fold metallo-hydrolase [Clostridium sp. CS001]|uniref:MBL fold metallo-hydrolase n=1 Tax=Clostridium sp. CS001 TaxID=2880648 RepID=UPI001CF18C67|nr:MBL fold metallo-hydrolase [Clostridium sp. CS001]MCB2288585.1 MBL fold metallo-hydrolase [Clostridium sp. CS001]
MLINDKDLYQFSTYIPQINLSFNQYLLLADEPILIHTGNVKQAEAMIPELKAALNGKDLKYIFISHFESDECGGLGIILKQFPNAKAVCSQTTAQQLIGFGLIDEVIIKNAGDTIKTNDYELEFLSYPSEMHLWEGLLAVEKNRGIFFSSDLMMAFGSEMGRVNESNWHTEVNNIRPEQVPDPEKRAQLQQALLQLNPSFVAAGHGPCLKL